MRKRLLIVDDCEANRDSVADLLRVAFGLSPDELEVETAALPELDARLDGAHDLVIFEPFGPRDSHGDRIEAATESYCRRLRAIHARGAKALVLTTQPGMAQRRTAQALTKPADPRHLLATVREAIGLTQTA